MPVPVREYKLKFSEAGLLERFERSLPKFGDLNEEDYVKFVRTLRILSIKHCVSYDELYKNRLEDYRSHIECLNTLHKEYENKDKLIASAIATIMLHIESYYGVGREAALVHTLTGLHFYLSDEGVGAKSRTNSSQCN